MHPVEVRTIAKVAKRLVPFLIVCYFIAYLDRVNVGFAALTMNQDLACRGPCSASAPASSSSHISFSRCHLGARKWIARIMLSWGIISGMMAFTPTIARVTGAR